MLRPFYLFALVLVVALVGVAPADTIKYLDGEAEGKLWVSGIGVSGKEGSLQASRITGGDFGRSVIVPIKDIEYVEFREPGDSGVMPLGRLGHVTDASGKTTIYNATVVGGGWRNGSFFLRFRKPGVPASGPADDLKLESISQVRLAPPPIGSAAAAGSAPKLGASAGGSYLNDGATDEAPTLIPTDDLPPSQRGPQTPEEMLDQLTRGSGTPGQPSSPFLIKPMPEENPFSLQAQGVYVIFAGALGLGALTFVFGTFILMAVARNEGMKDFTVGRAIAVSALLAFVPPFLFALCYVLIPVFISIKLFAGVLCFYFSARMIVMGFFEVLEGKANDILISFYALLLLIVAVAGVYMNWGK